jgi:hypothetical protein
MHNCALSKHCRKLPEQPISCCDFRTGCLIAHQLLPDDPGLAQGVLAGSRHIAEALFLLGVTGYGQPSIDMALAIQDARTDPADRLLLPWELRVSVRYVLSQL